MREAVTFMRKLAGILTFPGTTLQLSGNLIVTSVSFAVKKHGVAVVLPLRWRSVLNLATAVPRVAACLLAKKNPSTSASCLEAKSLM